MQASGILLFCFGVALQVHLYSMHGQKLPRSFSLGAEVARERVTDCVLYGDGLVALTGMCRFPADPHQQEA